MEEKEGEEDSLECGLNACCRSSMAEGAKGTHGGCLVAVMVDMGLKVMTGPARPCGPLLIIVNSGGRQLDGNHNRLHQSPHCAVR